MNEINVDFNEHYAYLDKILAHLSQVRSSEGSAFRICTPILNLRE